MRWAPVPAVAWLLSSGCLWTSSHVPPDAAPELDGPPLVPDAPCAPNSAIYEGQFGEVTPPFTRMRGAVISVHADPDRVAVTDSDGRFALCTPQDVNLVLDVSPADDFLGGRVYLESFTHGWTPDAFGVAFTPAALAAVLAANGQSYDASLGVLIVAPTNAPRQILRTGTAGAPLAYDSGGWRAGDDGQIVMFPNVTPGTVTLDTPGGDVAVPVPAGGITWAPMNPIPI